MTAGDRLGPYEVLGLVGSGGMGEVYRARDPTLNRDVAIKILPEALAADPAALARFEREAQAVAALSHPNILAIFDFGRQGDTAYAVMELLEGETLRARLAQGALPVRKAVDLAAQIAEGLAAAHEKGIVHRDLKPENVFVTHDGRAKVLDFGLAKRTGSASGPSLSMQATTGHTGPGTVMGTVGYMSPEQVRGEAVDHRSDIFSFGAALYEMLTGRQAFGRETATESMTAILKEDPPEITAGASGPTPGLQRIVQHCLEKKPGERFQSARDVAFALQALSGSATAAAMAQPPGRRWSWRWVALSVVLAVVAAVAGWAVRGGSAPLPSFRKLTFGRGAIDGARFVPGSRDIVYSARWQGDPSTVSLLREGSAEPRALEAQGALLLAASSQTAAVLTQPVLFNGLLVGTVSVMPLAGGGTRDVSRNAIAADFAEDGICLVTMPKQNVYQLEWPAGNVLVGPSPSLLRSPRVRDSRVAFFESSPSSIADGAIRVLIKGAQPRTLTRCSGFTALAWGPGEDLWFSTFDGGESRIEAVSPQGRIRLLARYPGRLELVDVDPSGRCLATVGSRVRQAFGRAPGADRDVDLTWLDAQAPQAVRADGSQVLLARTADWDMSHGVNLYLRSIGGGAAVNVGMGSLAADLSPDGQWVATFDANAKSEAGVRLIPTGAGASRWYPLAGAAAKSDGLWFHPRGDSIYLVEEATFTLSRLDLATGALVPNVVPVSVGYISGQEPIAPDGRRMLFTNYGGPVATDSLPIDYLLFEGEGAQPRPVKGSLRNEVPAGWAENSQEIYLYDRNALPAAVVLWNPVTGSRRPFLRILPSDPSGVWGIQSLHVTPSGRAYAYSVLRTFSDLYLIEGLK
jgi:eukaryotic-like serine/threonine-protein kinase